jgi:putative nucleotidyltransferase with HDIG domain
MEKLTAKNALDLLFKSVIHNSYDLDKPENKWVKHCIYVGVGAGRIAAKLGIDSDYAQALGYVHDIGRKISHPNHTIAGYKYMISEGYQEEARSCLTHSFIDNNIYYTAGGLPKGQDRFDYLNNFLQGTELTIYDNIVQMCDLFCLDTGFTTIERRLLDITVRKGVFDNSLLHLEKTIELKNRLEEMMGCSLYELFPEIEHEALALADEEHSKLLDLLNPNLIDISSKLSKKQQ